MNLFWTIFWAIIAAFFALIIITWLLGTVVNGFLGNPVGKAVDEVRRTQ